MHPDAVTLTFIYVVLMENALGVTVVRVWTKVMKILTGNCSIRVL